MTAVRMMPNWPIMRPRVLFGAKPQETVPEALRPKTGLHDFFTSRSHHQPQHNGVHKMDILPLHDKSDWFRIDDLYQPMIAQKKALLQKYRDIVSATLPDGQAGASELLEEMTQYLAKHFPDKFQLDGRVFKNQLTGDQYDLDNLPDDPIIVAGQLVQEDLVLLHQRADGKFYLTSASLSFPSSWSLPQKLDTTIDQIHEPVTTLNQNLGGMISRFLGKLNPEKPFWRINYLISASPEWTHLPDVPETNQFHDGIETTEENADRLYLRNEREVFMRMPKSGDVLFSLKTYLTPLKDLSGTVAKQLADVLKTLPIPFTEEYKDWTPEARQALITYLERKGQPPVQSATVIPLPVVAVDVAPPAVGESPAAEAPPKPES